MSVMRTFSVKNFEKFQHYKDRSPPWIKLYNELLDDYVFGKLPDASKFHLVAIWLLASRSGNVIHYDSDWIAKRINATDTVNLDILVEAGFIVVNQEIKTSEQYASAPLASCSGKWCPERESESESESESEKEAEERQIVAPAAQTEPASAAKRGTRLPKDWQPSDEDIAYAADQGLNPAQIKREADSFRDYWHAKPSNATKLDWAATWRTWVRRAAERLNQNKTPYNGARNANGHKRGGSAIDGFDALQNAVDAGVVLPPRPF